MMARGAQIVARASEPSTNVLGTLMSQTKATNVQRIIPELKVSGMLA